eukprot:1979300-Amphidinium_carterae.1
MRRHVPSYTQRPVDVGRSGGFEPSVLSPLYGRGHDVYPGHDMNHGCGSGHMMGMHGNGVIPGGYPNMSNVHGVHGI